ncbi:hypothetical protein, partial [Bacillus sp. JJ722]|uniref:hypothetical protein n=1 Tax=Bacillus sp. JJ722 TaxID=3122973 RepID=UPI002FFF3F15
IYMYYDYKFSGLTVDISKDPSLKVSGSKVSWKSDAMKNKPYVKTRSLWAEAGSRTAINSVTVSGGADIYKGSNIYRPYDSETVNFITH